MKLVDFLSTKPTDVEIDRYYQEISKLIEHRFDPTLNPLYEKEFQGCNQDEIDQLQKEQQNELSTEAGFALLAYIETLFRTDFVHRLETRKLSCELTRQFHQDFDFSKKPYQYGLDKIFYAWKLYGNPTKAMADILNNLPQYFEYRNWVAHGRYWVFKESNYEKKYDYESIQMLLYKISENFGSKLKL